jgi:hypothetical protein
VEFSDVYETTFPRYSKSLEWFGRNIGGGLSSSGT